MNKDYLKSARQEAAIYDALVTPRVNLGTYTREMEAPTVQPGAYKPEDSDVTDWTKDAFTDWSVKRSQVNSDTSKGKAVMLNDDLDTIQKAEEYLTAVSNADVALQALNKAVSEGKPINEISAQLEQTSHIVNNTDYQAAYQKIANRDLSVLTRDDIDFNFSKRDTKMKLSQLSRYKEGVLDKQSAALDDADKYDSNTQYWNNKHKISDYYNAKSMKEGFNFTDIDTYLYKAPGLLGSSASSMLAQGAAMAGGILASSAATAAGAAITAGTGGAAAPLAVAMVGAVGSASASIFSRSEESYAEVYQNYKDKVKRQSEKDGSYKLALSNARKQIDEQGTDSSQFSDDQVTDMLLTNKVQSGNTKFDKNRVGAVEGLESLYTDNMALSGVDIAQTAISVMPYGAIARKTAGLKKLADKAGKLSTTLNKATDLSGVIGERVGQVAAFGAATIGKALARKTMAKSITQIGGKIVLTSAMEGMEEGTQYIKGQEYINNEFDTNPNLVKSFIKNLGTQARSLYAAVTPFDSMYSTDAEFMENFKGGALLGGLMTGVTIGAQEVSNKVQTGNTSIGKQLNADEFVSALYAERVADRDLFTKNMEYSKAVRNSSKSNIDASFDELSKLKIEGIDPAEVAKEKERANRVMAQAESSNNKRIAAQNGIDPRTEDYDILVALQEQARDRYKAATMEANSASADVNSVIGKVDWSTVQIPADVDQLQFQTAIVSQARQNVLDRLIRNYSEQEEGLSEISKHTGTKTSKSDVTNVKHVLSDMLVNQQETHKIATSGLDMSNVGISGIDTKLEDTIEKQIYSEIDAAMLKNEIKILNGAYTKGKSKTTLAKQAVEKYKAMENRETVQEQTIQNDVRGVVEEPKQVEITPVAATTTPVITAPTVTQIKPEVTPVVDTPQVTKEIEQEPDYIIQSRSKALQDVQAQSIHPAVKVAENALKQVYESSIRSIPGIRPLKGGYAEFKAINEVDQYSMDENEDIDFWTNLYDNKSKLQEAIIDNDMDAADTYSKAIYDAIADRKWKAEAEVLRAQREAESAQITANREAAELSKSIDTAQQISPIIPETESAVEQQTEEQADEKTEDAPTELLYNRSVDPFSHQLNYWVNRKTNEPFQGYEVGFESSEEFAKVSTKPDFLEKADVEFVVKPYVNKEGVSTDAIYAEFTYDGKKYVAAIADPTSLRNYVSRGRSFDQTNTVIDNLNLLRSKILFLHSRLKPGTKITPTLLERTDGVIVNLKNEDGSPKSQKLTDTELVPNDPFLITPETVQIGVSTGTRGNEYIRFGGSIVNGKGTRLGQAYLMHNNKPIQLITRKFKQDPGTAELIFQMLTADPLVNVTLENGTKLYHKPMDILSMLVNYGSQTAVKENDPRLSKAQYDALKLKQFYTDENRRLHIGDKVYEYSELLSNPTVKSEVTSYINENFHWNIDEDGLNEWYLGKDNTPFSKVKFYFEVTPNVDKLILIPGVLQFDRRDVGLNEQNLGKGLSIMGWYVRQGVLSTDFGGYKDANIYVADVTTTDVELVEGIAESIAAQTELQNAPTTEIEDSMDLMSARKPKSNKTNNPIMDDPDIAGYMRELGIFRSVPVTSADSTINTQHAKQWLERTLGLTDEVQIVDNIIDVLKSGQVVVGRAKLDSIELSKLAPEGTQYHEAWHRVSNLMISERKRRQLYDQYNKRNQGNLNDAEIDELLADQFMDFQLYAEPKINYQVTNWFKKIANFINTWSKVGNLKLAKLYYDINVGKYRNAIASASNIARYKTLYAESGPNFIMKGVELKSIQNTKDYNNVLDTLTFLFFSSNNIIDYNDIDKLQQNKQDGIARLKLVLQAWNNKLSGNDTVSEIYNNFDTVFAPALTNRLKLYNTTAFEKAERVNSEDVDAGETQGINIGEHTLASYEVSKRDNAPAEVKFFFQTIPAYKFDEDGKKTVETDSNTGFPKFTDPRKAWNTILIDLHDIQNLDDLTRKVGKLAETSLFYSAVATKLKVLREKQESTDEKIASAAEISLTKLENTIRSHKHLFITGKITRNEDGLIEVNIKDNAVDTKAVQYPKIWSSSLFYNINKLGVFQQNPDGTVTLTQNGKDVFSKFITNFTSLKRAFTQGRGTLKIASGEFDIHQEENQAKVKDVLVNMLNSVGIQIDVETINQMLTSGQYGDDHKLTSYQLLNNLVINTNQYGGLQSIATVLEGILNQVKLQRSDVITTIDSFNKDHTTTKVRPIDIWNNRGWVKLLAQSYAQSHVNSDELRSLGADGNSLYSIAQNNFASDQVARFNRDKDYVSKLNSVVFNRGSLLLKHINIGDMLQLETFVNFKDDTAFDTGRDYFQITDREDYVAKMSMTFSNRILFPTVADKKTYHVIRGAQLFHERPQFTSHNGTQSVRYGDNAMKQFISYFESEVAAIELCMQQIDDTLDKDGHHNPNWVSPERRVKNYHTGNKEHGPNGVHFRLVTGIYYMSEGKEHFLNFNDPNKTPSENLQTAKNWLGNPNLPFEVKASLISSTLSKTVAKEIQKAKDLGLITSNDNNDIYSIQNVLLDQRELNLRKQEYIKSGDQVMAANAEGYAIYDMLADYTINSIISIVEVEKLFSGDPAYYKYKWGKNGIIDMSIDKIKRLGALTSTGLNNRLDFGSRFVRPTYNTAELNDYEIASKQYAQLEQSFIDGSIYDFVRVYHGDAAIYNEDGTYKSIDDLKTDPEYNDAVDAATLQARKEVSGYKSGINVADAAVYVSPNMYRDMMRMIGQWSTEVEEAFKILTDPSSNRLWESDPVLYKKVLKASLKPLKYMAFGQRLSEIAGLGVPYFNKMALFPLFESVATGDMKPLYDRMTGDNPLDMVMFNSAVKAGSVGAMDYYNGDNIADLNNLVVYTQSFDNLRQQLNTDPHTHEEQMAGTQMLKVGLSNIHMDDLYGNTNKITGQELKTEVFNTMNALSDIGARKIEAKLMPDGIVDRKALYKSLQDEAIGSDSNDNIISGLAMDESGKPIIPLAACSDNNFVESSFISTINKKTIDIDLPGGSFIQRSTFGLEASSQSVVSDSMLNNGKRLNLLNEDGSMDSIVSINLFKHIIPGYKRMTFTEAKQWLIDHDIIGDKSTATAIGYRIPTQAIASISALRFTDVLPEIMGDTIILPEEFTKLTGSDKH